MAKTRGTAGRNNRPVGTRAPGDYRGWGAGQGEYLIQGGFLISPTGQILDVMKIAGVNPTQGASDIEVYHGEAMSILGPQEGWSYASYTGAADSGWSTARLWGGLGSRQGRRYVSIRVPGEVSDPSQFRRAKRILQGLIDLNAADYAGTVDITFDYGRGYGRDTWNGPVNTMLDTRNFEELRRGY